MKKRPMESYCLGEIEQIARHNRKIALQTIRDARNDFENGEMSTADYITICNICRQLAAKWDKVVTAINAD